MVIGVTGLVGSGKSTFAHYLMNEHSILVDADQLVHEQWESIDGKLSSALIAKLGPKVISECGTVDRQSVRKYLSRNPSAITTIEQLLHPRVSERIQEIIAQHPNQLIILDVPLLFEAELEKVCDYTIQISASLEVRKARLMMRDGESKALQLLRINERAWSESLREAHASFVVDGNGKLDSFYHQAQEILHKIAKP